jgi:putative thioredoxin
LNQSSVVQASADNFERLVLENSNRGLVLVFYWTPKAGPCMRLMPRLVDLAERHAGNFLLVLANTDELGPLARAQGVTSVPTVKFYLRGEVAHTIHGAETDSTFRAAIGRFIDLEADPTRLAALRAHQEGRLDDAINLLARAAVERPDDLGICADLAKLLNLSGQGQRALELLTSLPPEARRDARIAPLLAHLELLDAASEHPNADTGQGQLATAARALLDDDLEAALEHLTALAETHPEYRDDIGRRALLALFALMGPDHELSRRYRARLSALRA